MTNKSDPMRGHIAIGIAPGLRGQMRAVGHALLEHYNRKTGQCDPGLERIARLLGIGRSVVAAATADLCAVNEVTGEPIGFFIRTTHGGHSHRTSYVPRWDYFEEIIDDWRRRMRDGSPPSNVRKSGRLTSGNPDVNDPEIRTQTHLSNPLNKPTVQVEGSETGSEISRRLASEDGRKGLRKREIEHEPQRFLIHAIPGGKVASRQDAAAAAEARRAAAEINKIPDANARTAAWLAAMDAKR